MTAVWDIVQKFLTGIGELKDPNYYEDALRFMKALLDDIHTLDHLEKEGISKALARYRSFKDIEKFVKRIK